MKFKMPSKILHSKIQIQGNQNSHRILAYFSIHRTGRNNSKIENYFKRLCNSIRVMAFAVPTGLRTFANLITLWKVLK